MNYDDPSYAPFTDAITENELAGDVLLAASFAPVDGSILDAPCGYGRLSVPLLDRGFDVTGVDRSPSLVGQARARASAKGHDGRRFRVADLKEVVLPPAFDLAVCWHHSLGFGTVEDDALIVATLVRALRPGGTLLVHQLNAPAVVANLGPSGVGRFETTTDDFAVEDVVTLTADGTAIRTDRTVSADGRRRTVSSFVARLYTERELRGLAEPHNARMSFIDTNGGALRPWSRWLVMVLTVPT